MLSFLLLGFLLGLRHALEADHLAAITALNDAGSSLGSAVRRGITWGAGHTATLLAVGAVCLFARWTPPPRFEQGLEMGVGAMLVVLGIGVLRRLRRERIVWRPHRHADGQRHLHAHRHTPAAPHRHARDRSGGLRRASIVGMVHGLAGSAALVLLVLPVFTSPWHGVAYIALFGLGSILGMTILSAVIALPLGLAHRSAAARAVLQTAVGWSTLACGAWVLWLAV